jgi:hypothetical protein
VSGDCPDEISLTMLQLCAVDKHSKPKIHGEYDVKNVSDGILNTRLNKESSIYQG